MTFRNDETIQCVRCGHSFTWSYGEQRFYRENNLHQPKHCPECREIRRGELRSSQMDHPAWPVEAAPPPFAHPEPIEEPTLPTQPAVEKRPSRWASSINRYNVVLVLLIAGFAIVLVLFLLAIF